MDNTTPYLNGKSHHAPVNFVSPERPAKRERLLELVGKAVDLELQLKETMRALEAEARVMRPDELPAVLMAIIRPSESPTKGPEDAKVATPSHSPESLKGRIMHLMRDGKKRKSSAIIKALKATSIKSSVYHALKQLLEEGNLQKPEYGFYCKA